MTATNTNSIYVCVDIANTMYEGHSVTVAIRSIAMLLTMSIAYRDIDMIPIVRLTMLCIVSHNDHSSILLSLLALLVCIMVSVLFVVYTVIAHWYVLSSLPY